MYKYQYYSNTNTAGGEKIMPFYARFPFLQPQITRFYFLKGFACKNLKKFPPPVGKTIDQNTLLGPNFNIRIPDLRADERAGGAEHTK